MTLNKDQSNIAPENAVLRQHAIPLELRNYAGQLQLGFTGKRGRGRGNLPNLADIYYSLAKAGYDIVKNGASPEFKEIGKPDGCVMTRIKFDTAFDLNLRALKQNAEDGEYVVTPYKEISLISVAVTLMLVAMNAQKNPAPIAKASKAKK
jgi:hypothetical protein